MDFLSDSITAYIHDVEPLFTGTLGEVQKSAMAENMPIVPPEVAHLLKTLLVLKKPKDVLEIGCAVGFSAGLITECLAEGGHVTTIDRYDIMISDAKENFKRMGIEDKVTLLEGSAVPILAELTGEFDAVFLDAAKGQYINMLPDIMRLLKTDGLFIADDVLQNGRIAKERLAVPRRQRTIHTRMDQFLRTMCNTPGLVSCILPVGDGVLVSCKTKEFEGIDI